MVPFAESAAELTAILRAEEVEKGGMRTSQRKNRKIEAAGSADLKAKDAGARTHTQTHKRLRALL